MGSEPISSCGGPSTSVEDLLRKGGPAAIIERLGIYRNYLRLLADLHVRRQLQGKVDASDIVQETLLTAHRQIAEFRGSTEAELAAWLRAILASRIVDFAGRHYSTQQRNVRLERRIAEDLEASSQGLGVMLADQGDSPSSIAARREQAVLLADGLAQLPTEFREVLVLRHLEEKSFAEVAAEMDRSVESVKKLWARALVKIRRTMAQSG